ncbi:uncharacterized protein LOC5507745 [Nematostella vectensis]|uniref:uncharacterized protein LOC5507745 n=1 Tax=Nematostella vectensis TaxID=45351 RepID=UPI0020777952|nr:uncharacterized protein LOC5507745 [Nematostella vectensis]
MRNVFLLNRSALVEGMKSSADDGSNDNGTQKMNPLTVRIYDSQLQRVKTSFLDICMTSGGTAEDIFASIDGCLTSLDIPWQNCVAFGVDNASVNVGKRNSIMTRGQSKNDVVYFSGCQCHVVHSTAMEASTALTEATGFDVQDLMVDVFYWFDQSTKRKAKLVEYAQFCDQEYRKILKYGSTRWLSMEKVVTLLLKQYHTLRSYFLSEGESAPRFKRLEVAFRNPMTEVYLLFYQAALQIFLNLNLFLQRDDPLIGAISSSLKRFLQQLAMKFIPRKTVHQAASMEELLDAPKHLPDSNVDVGLITKTSSNKLVAAGDVSPDAASTCYKGA